MALVDSTVFLCSAVVRLPSQRRQAAKAQTKEKTQPLCGLAPSRLCVESLVTETSWLYGVRETQSAHFRGDPRPAVCYAGAGEVLMMGLSETNLVTYAFIWSGLGLIGSFLLLNKSARPERAIFIVLFSLPHAIIFGPIFLLMNLAGRPQKLCPFCQSGIDRDALVCPKCTRDLPKS
jgi:hypothetical protein